MPIASVVIPYLNSLVKILTAVGQAFATFMARLFGIGDSYKDIIGDWSTSSGTDYSEISDLLDDADDSSSNTASNLGTASDNAKKLKKQLMGFDEINNITSSDSSSSSSGSGSGNSIVDGLEWSLPTTDDPSAMVDTLTEKIEKAFADIFKPLQDSWDKYGGKIIENIQTAFENLKQVGTSVMDIIGAKWSYWFGSFTDMFFSMQTVGSTVFVGITELIKDVWTNGGAYLFVQIGNLGARISELATTINDYFVTPFLEGINKYIIPVIGEFTGGVLYQIGQVIKDVNIKIGEFSDKLKEIASGINFDSMDTILQILGGILAIFTAGGLITHFGSLLEMVVKITTFFPAVGNLLASFGGLSGIFTEVSTAVSVFFQGLQEGMGITSAFQTVVPNMSSSLVGLINPFTLATAGIIAFASAFVYLYTTSEDFRNKMNGIFSDIGSHIQGIFNGVITIFNTVYDEGIKPLWDGISKFVSDLMGSGLATFIEGVSSVIGNLISLLASFVENILLPIVNFILTLIVPAITTLINSALALIEPTLNVILKVVGNVMNAISPIISFIANNVLPVFKNIFDILTSVADIIMTVVSVAFQVLAGVFGTIIGLGIDAIFSAIGTVLSAIGSTISPIIDALGDLWDFISGMAEVGAQALAGFLQPFKDIASNVLGFFQDMLDGILSFFGIHSPSTVFCDMGTNILQGLVNGLSGLVDTVVGFFKSAWEGIKNAFSTVSTFFGNCWTNVKNAFGNVGSWFSGIFSTAWTNIKNAFNNVSSFFKGIWKNITGAFGDIVSWFKDKFSKAWTAVKNVFSTGGKIFNGIKDGILNGLKSVINGLIGGINKVIKVPFDGINKALKTIKKISILGIKPFSWLGTISVPQIPKLASGGLAYGETLAVIGEYQGAKSDPEVVSPLSKLSGMMTETIKQVISEEKANNSKSNNDSRYVYATFNLNGREFYKAIVEEDEQVKRSTGSSPLSQW